MGFQRNDPGYHVRQIQRRIMLYEVEKENEAQRTAWRGRDALAGFKANWIGQHAPTAPTPQLIHRPFTSGSMKKSK